MCGGVCVCGVGGSAKYGPRIEGMRPGNHTIQCTSTFAYFLQSKRDICSSLCVRVCGVCIVCVVCVLCVCGVLCVVCVCVCVCVVCVLCVWYVYCVCVLCVFVVCVWCVLGCKAGLATIIFINENFVDVNVHYVVTGLNDTWGLIFFFCVKLGSVIDTV